MTYDHQNHEDFETATAAREDWEGSAGANGAIHSQYESEVDESVSGDATEFTVAEEAPAPTRSTRKAGRTALIAAGLIAMTSGLAFVGTDWGTAPANAETEAAAQAVPVQIAKPLVTTIQEWDEYTGRFVAEEDVTVRARVSGYLTDVAFEDGDMVRKGDVLFRIDARPFQAELAAARAQLAQIDAQLANARSEAERGARLNERQALSKEEADRRTAAVAELAAARDVARARVEQARLQLSFTTVRAPISGRVSSDFVSEGNLIVGGAQGGTELTSIVSTSPILFEFTASESDYLKYTRLNQTGERASSRDAANPVRLRLIDETGFPHEGRMEFVDNRVDQSTGTMRGRAVFDNADGVFAPGMFGHLQLIASAEHEAVLIPDTAVQTDQTEKFVWVATDGVAERRAVTLGPIHEGLRIVRAGLDGSEDLITTGTQFVSPGASVAATSSDPIRLALNTAE